MASSREPLVVIVADTQEERLALTSGIPVESPILLASTIAQARRVLTQLPGASVDRRTGPQRTPGQRAGRLRGATGGGSGHPGGADPRTTLTDRTLRLREDRLSLALGEHEVTLTRLEFALLKYLLPRVGEVATFEQLSQVGWHTAYLGNGAHMHAAIGRLRLKLAELGAPLAVEAVRGLGFRLARHPRASATGEAAGN
ncbi:winged helix-turn-helix domain-containing protein [Ornithinimicrobium sp. F0845]|uniref:winged helix-turn-helix domain-containing protein n=1 Tax=Ornithinimicrobium sp. F0845 TaxID=2926412 RepID=UPI001FF33B02|nr:winged helix-turn-helix domain-containing protein [Ornithinimicrobium sp. F0845]